MTTLTDFIDAYGEAEQAVGYAESEYDEGRYATLNGTPEEARAKRDEARERLLRHLEHHGLR